MSHSKDIKQYVITVTGRVQGVFYRAATQKTAQRLGIKGWVKNKPDGSVQVTALGTTEQLEALLVWCRQGPDRSEVAHVSWEEDTPENFEGFNIRR